LRMTYIAINTVIRISTGLTYIALHRFQTIFSQHPISVFRIFFPASAFRSNPFQLFSFISQIHYQPERLSSRAEFQSTHPRFLFNSCNQTQPRLPQLTESISTYLTHPHNIASNSPLHLSRPFYPSQPIFIYRTHPLRPSAPKLAYLFQRISSPPLHLPHLPQEPSPPLNYALPVEKGSENKRIEDDCFC
uniref:Ovule protein n=1 Tax=Gongylonema pulchrum TaxID=637853 RepID=A0A183EE71_9BILA